MTWGGANLNDLIIEENSASSALLMNTNQDPDGETDNMTFISDGTGHAIELGANTPTTITLRGQSYAGYATIDGSTGNEVIYNNSAKAITINILDGGDTPTIRNGASASTTVNNQVDLTINVQDEAKTAIQNAQVSIFLLDSPFTQLMNEDTTAGGVATEGFNYSTPTDIKWRVRKSETTDNPRYFSQSGSGQISADGFSLTVTLKVNTFI